MGSTSSSWTRTRPSISTRATFRVSSSSWLPGARHEGYRCFPSGHREAAAGGLPEVFGLHPNADLTFRTLQVRQLVETVVSTMPKSVAVARANRPQRLSTQSRRISLEGSYDVRD